MKSVIVGTAGHIDHGKSALVRALTGTDPDRWEEEKRRGITIDLGFAHLDLPSSQGQLRLGFVDVPGHERFVRNMLAGAGGIDVVLLVVAADEGIKPQTREHFDICRMLSVKRGIVILTKSDLVDAETLDVVRMEVADLVRGSFLEGAPVVPVSSLTGSGLDELRAELAKVAAEVTSRDSSQLLRLPIDRVFTIKGHGTVVTGTTLAGMVRKEDEVELFPLGRRARVRSVQVHDLPVEQAIAGQRTALNLAGVEKETLSRGMMLATPGVFRPTNRVDVRLDLLPSAPRLKTRSRVHLHVHTAETIAEIVLIGISELKPKSGTFAELRLAEPLLLLPGDRFIIRQFSPVVTIGGGVVLDNAPRWKNRDATARAAFLETLAAGDQKPSLFARISRHKLRGTTFHELVAETGWTEENIRNIADLLKQEQLVFLDPLIIAAGHADVALGRIRDVLKRFHDENPLVPGIQKEELANRADLSTQVVALALHLLTQKREAEISGELVRSAGRGVQMKDDEAEAKQVIEKAFASAGLKVPALKEVLAGLKIDLARAQRIVTLLLRERILVKLSDDLVFHRDALEGLKQQVRAMKTKSPQIDVAKFKDTFGITRKYAIPLLEFLDRERVTRRVGDSRQIL